ncbi:hypothetical protein [Streptosporangium nondiastaticum]|uniref:hypothetical protein n=1 Tax=Streptosporangium nondiastaticum TaxID=35764 RepID=UPI001678308C|nr:hypothetical protein [Streptosporangium nondiastaticum]
MTRGTTATWSPSACTASRYTPPQFLISYSGRTAPRASSGGCGTYTVSMSYSQKGPYWAGDGSDVHVQRNYQINVPCA